MSGLQILIVAAVVIWMIIRRFAGSPVGAKTLALPIVLTVYGLVQLDQGRHGHFTTTEIALLAIEALVGVLAGVGRGVTIKLYERDGHLWQRYTVLTLAAWIGMIILRIGLAVGGHAMGAALPTGGTLMVTFGISLLIESLVVQKRAFATGVAIMPAQRGRRRLVRGMR
jgi:hypothetical protein